MHTLLNRVGPFIFAALMVGCAHKETTEQATTAQVMQNTCAGRYLIGGPPSMQVSNSTFFYYWGDVKTWQESEADFATRLQNTKRSVELSGKLIGQPKQLSNNAGIVLLTQDDDSPPFDPNITQLIAYGYHNGVSVEFKKRSTNKLLPVAMDRAAEILNAAQAMPKNTRELTDVSFCAGAGAIKLTPQPGWYEGTQLSGTFAVDGHTYHYMFSTSILKTHTNKAEDQQARRDAVADALQAKFIGDYATNSPSRSMRFLRFENEQGAEIQVYEWNGKANDPATPYLYIWSTSQNNGTLQRAANAIKNDEPVFLQVRELPKEPNPRSWALPPKAEESMYPYSRRFMYKGSPTGAPSMTYAVIKNGQQVYKGTADKNGFTQAFNGDYLDHWESQAFGH